MNDDKTGIGNSGGLDDSAKADIVAKSATNQFDTYSKQIVGLMKDIAPLADQRASTFLMILGAVALILSFIGKIKIGGVAIAELQTIEFIGLVITSLLLLGGGTAIRVYQQHFANRSAQAISETGARMIEKTQDTAVRLLERTHDTAAEMTAAEQRRQEAERKTASKHGA